MKKWMIIVIIVAIAAIGGFIYYGRQQAGRGVSADFHRTVGLGELQKKLETDKSNLGFYPPELGPSEAIYLDRGDPIPGRKGPWGIQKIDYQYAVNSDKTDYVLGVRLEDTSVHSTSKCNGFKNEAAQGLHDSWIGTPFLGASILSFFGSQPQQIPLFSIL